GTGMGADGNGSRLLVLIVEDHLDTLRTTAQLVCAWGHAVTTAADGAEALRVVEERPPDVILLDLGLPGLDGWEVARRLRERAGPKRALVVAVSGFGKEEDKSRSAQCGIALHLTKPVDPDSLARLLARMRQILAHPLPATDDA